jgi:hypothetical protein
MGGDNVKNLGETVPQDELKKRIAILRRFRELLVEQRERFRNYLSVLEKQKSSIASGSADELSAHVEIEEKIVADIFSVQKSIEPIREMFEFSWKDGAAPDIEDLKSSLDGLKNEASRRIVENKKLLQHRMTVLRDEIKNAKTNPFNNKRRSVYNDGVTASLLDIKG